MTPEALLSWMDEKSIDKAVLLPLESPESSYEYVLTRDCLRAAARYPDRLISFANRDPRAEANEQFIRMAADQGAKGMGEVKLAVPFDDPIMLKHYELCNDLGWPLLFHMDKRLMRDEFGLPRLESMLQAFPRIKFIGHAPGFWRNISGSAAPGPLISGAALDRLFSSYPNLYGDISANSGYWALTRDIPQCREFIIRHRRHILFGTDMLSTLEDLARPHFDLPEVLHLDEEVWRDITEHNPRRVLGLA
jgi:predicted TIM-barrel fold metal-dependent hydrolase